MTEERWVISELVPISIVDMDTGDSYPLKDEGIFETVCILLNAQNNLIEQKNKELTNLLIENQKLKDKNKKFKEELHEILEELREILKYDQR